jgi:hypothetical protein
VTPRSLAIVAAALSFAPAASGAPAWCAAAQRALDEAERAGDESWERYQQVVQHLPVSATPITEDARRRAGEEGDLSPAYRALRGALEEGCREPLPRAATDGASAQLRALMDADERFAGERKEPDAVDRLKERIAEWLEELLESQLMRRYAGASRAVYLSVLALFLLFVGVRLWRARARERGALRARGEQARVERRRKRAFAAWRAQADERLADGELREALRAGQLALLARLGEVREGAVSPARTQREIARALDDKLRAAVEPPLQTFERAFYGGHAEREVVTAFLADVDAAAARIEQEG